MRIGIFGGSFNPPHLMHKYIVDYLLENDYLDEVIVVPTGKMYTYKNNLLDDKYRLDMLNIMFKDNNNVLVSDYELKDHVVYTYDSLEHFKEEYPNDSIYFICGADNLDYIDKWYKGNNILKEYKIIAVKREGFNIDELLYKYKDFNITLSNIPLTNISSTEFRNNINNNKNVDKDVLVYIKKNKLYGRK